MGSVEHDTAKHLEDQAVAEARFEAHFEYLEEEAVRDIVDTLLCGRMYPPSGRGCIIAGDYLRESLDDDEIANALNAYISGEDTAIEAQRDKLRKICEEELSAWLRKRHSELIEQRVEELMADEDE